MKTVITYGEGEIPTKFLPDNDVGGEGYVYFIQCEQFVKIGTTKSIRNRLTQIQIASPHAVRLVHWEKGGKWMEALLHEKFAAQRERGEWYRIEGPLLDFILKSDRGLWRDHHWVRSGRSLHKKRI